jgi:Zn-dependent alcohol dehydrogenase
MQVQAAVCYEKSAPFQIKILTLGGLGLDGLLVKIVGSGLSHIDFAARYGLFLCRSHVCSATKTAEPL